MPGADFPIGGISPTTALKLSGEIAPIEPVWNGEAVPLVIGPLIPRESDMSTCDLISGRGLTRETQGSEAARTIRTCRE